MRILRNLALAGLAGVLLSGCMSLLLGSRLERQLMASLIAPLVGQDPNAVGFFEIPAIHQRLEPLLGERYEPAVRLLKTANQIQSEGVLYYLMSRHVAAPAQELAQRTGLAGAASEVAAQAERVEAVREMADPQALAAAAQQLQEQAGLVWNATTNQFAVVLIERGKAEILAEQVEGGSNAVTPVLPAPLQAAYDAARALEQASQEALTVPVE